MDEVNSLLQTVSTFSTETPGEVVEDVVNSADAIFQVIEGLSAVNLNQITTLPPPMNTTAFWADFALDLPEYLIVTYLESALPPMYALLLLGGVIVEEVTDDDPPRTLHHLDWSQLTGLLTNTAAHLSALYGWGADSFDYSTLLARLAALGLTLGLQVERVGALRAADRAVLRWR